MGTRASDLNRPDQTEREKVVVARPKSASISSHIQLAEDRHKQYHNAAQNEKIVQRKSSSHRITPTLKLT